MSTEIHKNKARVVLLEQLRKGEKNPATIQHKIKEDLGKGLDVKTFHKLYKQSKQYLKKQGKARYINSNNRPSKGTIINVPWDMKEDFNFKYQIKVQDKITGEIRKEYISVYDDKNLVENGKPKTKKELENYASKVWKTYSMQGEEERKSKYQGELVDISLHSVYKQV